MISLNTQQLTPEELVEQALNRTQTDPITELYRRGIEMVEADLRFGPVVLRGRLEVEEKRLYFDPVVLAELQAAMSWAGLPGDPLEIVAAHELFHLLQPDCHGRQAEQAAHLFATRMLGLPYSVENLDPIERTYKRRRRTL